MVENISCTRYNFSGICHGSYSGIHVYMEKIEVGPWVLVFSFEGSILAIFTFRSRIAGELRTSEMFAGKLLRCCILFCAARRPSHPSALFIEQKLQFLDISGEPRDRMSQIFRFF